MSSARAGNPDAIAALSGPDIPPELMYLYQWLYELHGRSGFTPAGLAPLTYTTIRDWAAMKCLSVLPHEVDALIQLDAVLLHPEPSKSSRADADDPLPVAHPASRAWPTRAGSAPIEGVTHA